MSEDVSGADVVVDAAAPDLWPGTEAGQGGKWSISACVGFRTQML